MKSPKSSPKCHYKCNNKNPYNNKNNYRVSWRFKLKVTSKYNPKLLNNTIKMNKGDNLFSQNKYAIKIYRKNNKKYPPNKLSSQNLKLHYSNNKKFRKQYLNLLLNRYNLPINRSLKSKCQIWLKRFNQYMLGINQSPILIFLNIQL